MKLIYIVEDHKVIREGVGKYLEHSGFSVELFEDLASARAGFARRNPDLLIQDVMLPDGDGFDFVNEIKKVSDIPVVFMTARISEEDRIKGFLIGADDYISKPFSPKELVLRVQAILHRVDGKSDSEEKQPEVYSCGDSRLIIDQHQHKLSVDNIPVAITAAEWRIFLYLIEKNGAIIPRSEILHKCFEYSSASYERIADTHIKNLRAKLGNANWIETVRGYGYRFTGSRISCEGK